MFEPVVAAHANVGLEPWPPHVVGATVNLPAANDKDQMHVNATRTNLRLITPVICVISLINDIKMTKNSQNVKSKRT